MKIYIVKTARPEAWVCEKYFKSLKEAKEYLFYRCNPVDEKSPEEIEDSGLYNKYGTFYAIQELNPWSEK